MRACLFRDGEVKYIDIDDSGKELSLDTLSKRMTRTEAKVALKATLDFLRHFENGNAKIIKSDGVCTPETVPIFCSEGIKVVEDNYPNIMSEINLEYATDLYLHSLMCFDIHVWKSP